MKDASLQLINYQKLICNLPYMEQAFETSIENWKSEKYAFSEALASFLERHFKEGKLKISRADLFNLVERDQTDTLLSIIMWGYPRGMRGNSFERLLKDFSKLKYKIIPGKELSLIELEQLLNSIDGIGLSTLSKFLYFFGNKLEGTACLIFDSRIIEALSEGRFKELEDLNKVREFNKIKYFLTYLQNMQKLSEDLNCKPDQLELFLFMFGRHLKYSSAIAYRKRLDEAIESLKRFEIELEDIMLNLAMAGELFDWDQAADIGEVIEIDNSLFQAIEDSNIKKLIGLSKALKSIELR